MTLSAQIDEVEGSELSATIGALGNAARSLRDEAGRVTAALDGVASALDRERRVEGSEWEEPASGRLELEEPGFREPAAELSPPPGRDIEVADEGAPTWVPSLLCAVALIASVLLLKVGLVLAIPAAIFAAVLLPMTWWMPALAAVALGLGLAIQSPSGSMADKVAFMLVVFVLIAGALLLYELWQRLHFRVQA